MTSKSLFRVLMMVIVCGFVMTTAADATEDSDQWPESYNWEAMLTKTQFQGQGNVDYSTSPAFAKPSYRSIFLEEDFEAETFPPVGWDTINTDPGYGWFRSKWTGGGTWAAMVTWHASGYLQDEWLLTPKMDVSGAGSELRVEFYMLKGYTYPHDFKVHVSTNGGSNWTEIWDSDTTGYMQFVWWFTDVDLSNYAGCTDSIMLGFQYYGEDADLFGFDNVVVTDDPRPTGRCCDNTDPMNPICSDGVIQSDCQGIDRLWVEGLNCMDNPCPLPGFMIEPSDDMYTDPDDGSGHEHPINQQQLWTADYSAGCGNHHQRIMLRFDLSDYMGMEPDSVVLNIYRFFHCPTHSYTNTDFYYITEDWREDSWNERVHIGHEASPWISYNFGPANDWYRINISDAVGNWLDGGVNNYGLVIQARYNERWSKFYSKEGLHPPYLELYGVAQNQPPVLDSIGPKETRELDTLNFMVTASDPDQTIPGLYTSTPLPDGAVFLDNADGTGDFDWTPIEGQAETYSVTFYAYDGSLTDSEVVAIQVAGCCINRADINHDGTTEPDIVDLVYLVNYMFQDGPPPPCFDEVDVNGDSVGPDIADLVYLVTYMFQGGPALVPCP